MRKLTWSTNWAQIALKDSKRRKEKQLILKKNDLKNASIIKKIDQIRLFYVFNIVYIKLNVFFIFSLKNSMLL